MLIMFRAKNFASFRDEFVLDMRATNYREHSSHLIEIEGLPFKLLKTAAIYGANASGKSNLVSALFGFEAYISNHFFEQETDRQVRTAFSSIHPFSLLDRQEERIEFEMIFRQHSRIYQYGFAFEGEQICEEWFEVDGVQVFERFNDRLNIHSRYKKALNHLKDIRSDRLYLSFLDFFATGEIKEFVDDFKFFFKNHFDIHFELSIESSIKGAGTFSTRSLDRLMEDDVFRSKVAGYLRKIDLGVEDIVVEKNLQKGWFSKESTEVPSLKITHPVYNEAGEKTGSRAFELANESSGTLKFLAFIYEIATLMETGGVFIVDELSARLHPLVTKFIVDLFQSEENLQNAQLIFTTHDVSLLNNEQFRRDEVLFVDKNQRGESSLYSLADLKKVRQDATFHKDYFNGKYGAIPIIKEPPVPASSGRGD
ncbi:ATP-binding protein [Saccharibacillus sp. CPCC 101409]|uniref:AAA family ATPase n=1 Tax=Saccharibacillus sp. CPCC 101409 TaxID=3058041 RepID=UPI002670D7DC|nr:ATP-binding protein [Saccharibacillus sp. CPCC 101409]MDO3411111.1 ATP-binding protein [Saccharibacillus sp. CPCC 101409]